MSKPGFFGWEGSLHRAKNELIIKCIQHGNFDFRIANLGCPRYCAGFVCVDLYPKETGVEQSEANRWLQMNRCKLDAIYSKNMIEHLPNPGGFLKHSWNALKHNGEIMIVTDNAEFLPYYSKYIIHKIGVGAHGNDGYAMSERLNETHHYLIFSKMHLRNLMEYAGFADVVVKRVECGAKLMVTGVKP